MKSQANTIALLEIGGSHDECLLSQMHAIKGKGFEILLITTQKVVDRNPTFKLYINDFFIVNMSGEKREKKKEIDRIWQKLKNAAVHKVVINTAQGNLIRKLAWKALMSKIEFIGIIHTTRKFEGSFTQKLINWKIKKYLLLSEFLFNKVEAPKGIQLAYFYPIRYASKPRKESKEGKLICIIGGVESRRKDLDGFLDMAEKTPEVSYVFLGKSDPNKEEVREFIEMLKKRKLENRVLTFNQFVSQEDFDTTLQKADLILPLVHPDTPSADQYFKNQISGAMSVSFGYKIPMLIHNAYQHIEEMQGASFYYDMENFGQTVSSALHSVDRKVQEMNDNPQYSVENNEKTYVSFVLN